MSIKRRKKRPWSKLLKNATFEIIVDDEDGWIYKKNISKPKPTLINNNNTNETKEEINMNENNNENDNNINKNNINNENEKKNKNEKIIINGIIIKRELTNEEKQKIEEKKLEIAEEMEENIYLNEKKLNKNTLPIDIDAMGIAKHVLTFSRIYGIDLHMHKLPKTLRDFKADGRNLFESNQDDENENERKKNKGGNDPTWNCLYLDLSINRLKFISTLSSLPYLLSLNLASNFISEIHGFENLLNLQILSLYNNNLTSTTGIEHCRSLRYLDLSTNNITSLNGLNQLENLIHLKLGENKLNNLSEISSLNKIIYLEVEDNELTDLSSILNLGRFIEYLNISRNYMTNLSILEDNFKSFIKLKELKIGGCPCMNQSIADLRVLNILRTLKFLDSFPVDPSDFYKLEQMKKDSKVQQLAAIVTTEYSDKIEERRTYVQRQNEELNLNIKVSQDKFEDFQLNMYEDMNKKLAFIRHIGNIEIEEKKKRDLAEALKNKDNEILNDNNNNDNNNNNNDNNLKYNHNIDDIFNNNNNEEKDKKEEEEKKEKGVNIFHLIKAKNRARRSSRLGGQLPNLDSLRRNDLYDDLIESDEESDDEYSDYKTKEDDDEGEDEDGEYEEETYANEENEKSLKPTPPKSGAPKRRSMFRGLFNKK